MYATITLTDIVLLIFSIGREFCVPIGVGTHRAGGALAPPFEIVEGLSQSFFGNYN